MARSSGRVSARCIFLFLAVAVAVGMTVVFVQLTSDPVFTSSTPSADPGALLRSWKAAVPPHVSASPSPGPSLREGTQWLLKPGHSVPSVALAQVLPAPVAAQLPPTPPGGDVAAVAVHQRTAPTGVLHDVVFLDLSRRGAGGVPGGDAMCIAALRPAGHVALAWSDTEGGAPPDVRSYPLPEQQRLVLAALAPSRASVANLGRALAGATVDVGGGLFTSSPVVSLLLLVPPGSPALRRAVEAAATGVLPAHVDITVRSGSGPRDLLRGALELAPAAQLVLLRDLASLSCRDLLLARAAVRSGSQFAVTPGVHGAAPLQLAADTHDWRSVSTALAVLPPAPDAWRELQEGLEDAVGLTRFVTAQGVPPAPRELPEPAPPCDHPHMRVHVYDLPPRFNEGELVANAARPPSMLDPDCTANFYSAEVWMHRLLLRSAAVTRDGAGATWHYVPLYGTCHKMNNLPFKKAEVAAWHHAGWDWLRSRHGFFNASAGRDHVWLFSQGFGGRLFGDFTPIKPGVFLVHNGEVSAPDYTPGKDVPIPPVLRAYVTPLWEGLDVNAGAAALARERPHLAMFGGSIMPEALCDQRGCHHSKGVRQYFDTHLRQQPGFRIMPKRSDSYATMLRDSDFCLCPEGWHAWTPRPFEAVLSGCIPVIYSDVLDLPFYDIVPWRRLAVFIPNARVAETAAILRGISQGEKVAMRAAGAAHAHRFAWHEEPWEGDAFCSILGELERRAGTLAHAGGV